MVNNKQQARSLAVPKAKVRTRSKGQGANQIQRLRCEPDPKAKVQTRSKG